MWGGYRNGKNIVKAEKNKYGDLCRFLQAMEKWQNEEQIKKASQTTSEQNKPHNICDSNNSNVQSNMDRLPIVLVDHSKESPNLC